MATLLPYDWMHLVCGSMECGYGALFIGCAVSSLMSWPEDEWPGLNYVDKVLHETYDGTGEDPWMRPIQARRYLETT